MRASELAAALESMIRESRLTPGARLPTHRELAYQHGVALNTASHAVRMLTARGLVVGEVGRGTFVRSPHHVDASEFELLRNETYIDLSQNVLPLPGLAERFESAASKVLRRERASLLDYHPHAGRMIDRTAAARWLSRGGHLPDDPSRILICAGGQHAITVALMATTRPGDTIAVESLTWPGIQAAASALSLELMPLPMDDYGLEPKALGRLVKRRRIAALYCMPTLHNPTARTMPIERRWAVAELARKYDFQIIEDDAYGFLAEVESAPLSSLAVERSWYICSLSKSFAPGLRTAWLLAPSGQEQRAAQRVRATIWGATSLGSAIASSWIADGTAGELETERRMEVRARQEIAAAILPGDFSYLRSDGMHFWLMLPEKMRAQPFVDGLAARGVRTAPGSAFGVDCSPNAVRISLCAPTRADLGRALIEVAKSLNEISSTARS